MLTNCVLTHFGLRHKKTARYEVLLGFAESAENKSLFTEMTGFGWSKKFRFLVRQKLGL